MDTIVRYLKNPMEIGIYNGVAIIDFSKIPEYFKELIEKLKASDKRPRLPSSIVKERVSRLEEVIEGFGGERPTQVRGRVRKEDFFEYLTNAFSLFCRFSNDCPEKMRDIFTRSHVIGGHAYRLETRTNIFNSRLLTEFSDVIVIDKRPISNKKWLFDYVTIKEKSLKDFREKLETIPPIKKKWKTKRRNNISL